MQMLKFVDQFTNIVKVQEITHLWVNVTTNGLKLTTL